MIYRIICIGYQYLKPALLRANKCALARLKIMLSTAYSFTNYINRI